MSLSKGKPNFGYWNIRGFGQPIRFLLKYLKVDYVETTYNCTVESKFNDWDKVKESFGFDFPNLPYWIDSEVKLTESRAIIQYLCRKYDPSLLPSVEPDIRNAHMLDGVLTDVWILLVGVTYFNSKETLENYERNTPEKLNQVAKFIGKFGGPWSLGRKISYLDFLMYEILYHNLAYDGNLLDNLPSLKEYMRQFEEIPSIAAFIASPSCIKTPCFRPWARVSI